MKIFQFTPNVRPETLIRPGAERPGDSPKPGAAGTDFSALLKEASSRSEMRPNGSGKIISLENQRARQLPSPADLGQAGQLLGRLDAAIRSASPETLRGVHNLEGLVYVYAKTNG